MKISFLKPSIIIKNNINHHLESFNARTHARIEFRFVFEFLNNFEIFWIDSLIEEGIKDEESPYLNLEKPNEIEEEINSHHQLSSIFHLELP